MNRAFLLIICCLLGANTAFGANYYWVHTTNNWTDISNWRTASGGPTSHISVPGPTDDVFFDANSFPSATPTVHVNSAGFCRNITFSGGWANNPSITMAASLDIYGSFTLHTSINGATAFTGDLRFEGTAPGLTITTAGKRIGRINFNGVGGGWSITGPLLADQINHVNGSFSTNNHNIELSNDFRSNSSNIRSINLGTSTLDLYGWYAWDVNSNNLTLTANLSTINVRSTVLATVNCGASQAYNNINFIATAWGSSALNAANGTTFNNVSFADNCNISGSALQFNQVTCSKDGRFNLSASSTIQTLLLTSGKRYTFQNGQTLNVTNLTANGSCNGYIELRSTAPPAQATINNTSNNSLDRAIIEAINITPGPNNNATNSIDAGNNTGWTFTAPALNTCYWVGGTGNWGDAANHWANASGGTPGSACVPTFMDNVVFDANSFTAAGQTVTIDMQAYCNNMTWNVSAIQSPNFNGNGLFPLNIYGSLTLDADINNFNMTSPLFFRTSAPAQTITSAGKTFSNVVTFDGSGAWGLQDDFNVASWLRFFQGTLSTNNHNVSVNYFESNTNNNRTLNLGSSLVVVSSSSWNVSGNNFNLNAGTSTLRFPNNNANLNHTANPGNDYYNVEFNGTNQTNGGSLNNSSSGGSFNNVIFLGGGNLNSATTISNLTFSAAKNYVLNAGATYTITGVFTAVGNCSGYIDISSSSVGSQSTFHFPAGNTTIDYCVLRDQGVTGPGVHTANNSIDQGNNTGWVIPATAPRDLFWVGGSGNWSDQNHWATTPTGIGGACIPTLSDDVYFTQHSFTAPGQTVTVDIIANCRNMRWDGHAPTASGPATNNPAFVSAAFANNLNIYGSLTLIAGMNWNFNSNTYFRATSLGKTITSATQEFDRDVIFEGVGGEWILQDELRLNNSSGITHNRGIFRTNNFNVTAGEYQSTSGQARELYMGSSIFTLGQTAQGFQVSGTSMILDAGTSTINLNNTWINVQFSSPSATANRLYDVNFLTPNATTNIYLNTSGGTVYFHNVKFFGWGRITGNNVYNKLTFSPGKTYTLGSNQTQTVDTLDARGNNCFKIIIRSSTTGTQSTISQASGNVTCDFLDLRDQRATGGATFFAGQFSNNTGNNTGWIFNNAPGYIFGLGPDTAFQTCGSTITLTTLNFNATVSTSYAWNTGSTSDSLIISTPGTYWVTANYGAACLYTDSIRVTINPAIMNLQTSNDTMVCQGAAYSMSASGGVTYSWGPSIGLSSTTGANVIANPNTTTSYTVTAVNGLCTDNKIITVTVTPAPALNATAAASVCQGVFATLTVSGALTYSWSPAIGLSATTGSSVTANPTANTNYIVQGDNGGGCVSTATVAVTVGNTPVINIGSQTNVTCNGLSNGVVNLTASGGAGGYNFVWSNAQTGANITNLPAGTFTATVTDALGCTQTANIVVTEPTALSVSVASQTDAICNNSNTGTAALNASGGTAPFNYVWSGGYTAAVVTNLNAALYTVTVTDANNCVATNTVNISEPAAITLTMDSSDAICGAPNGVASVIAAGGVSGFVYQWMPGGATTTSVSSLAAGVYTVTVTDANGCTAVNTTTVVSAGSPTVAIASQTNVSCNGLADGSISVNAGGGNGTYSYLWSNVSTTPSISNLSQGVYTLTLTDGNGCTATTNATITEPGVIVINISSQNNVLCNGTNSANVVVNTSGGTGVYTYNWSNAITTAANNNIAAGIYTLTVTDANNCIETTTITVTEPPLLTSTVVAQQNVLCNGQANGAATVSASGGTGALTYIWSAASTDNSISNLVAGIYTLTITDANGCIASQSVTITEPPLLNVSVSASANICAGDNINLTASASGGTASYTFNWSPGAFAGNAYNVTPTASTTYSMIATDANGCTSGPHVLTINLPPPLLVNVSNPASICFGEAASLTANANGGSGGYVYNWLPGAANGSTLNVSPTASTTYTMLVIDNCTDSAFASVLITVNELPIVLFQSDITEGCGPLCVNFNNTTLNSNAVVWNFGDGNFSTNNTPQNCFSADGSYNVKLIVTNTNGCKDSATINNMITVYPNPTSVFNVSTNEATIVNPTIAFTDASVGATTWSWSFGDGGTSSMQNTYYTYNDTGYYLVKQITLNSFGCVDSSEQFIRIKSDYVFYIPNSFTPNGDGLNDEFLPKYTGLDDTRDYELSIYDRWGNLIFKSNNPYIGWNARKNNTGDAVVQDTYVWKIATRDIMGKSHAYDGHVNVIR